MSPAKEQFVDINWLQEHPRQREIFSDTSEAELNELASDLEDRGQQEAIHCCEDGTIIRGHRRRAAALKLGWSQVCVVIRKDLGDHDDPRVLEELVKDNIMRRRLGDLELARCYRKLKQIADERPRNASGDQRDLIAQRLNCGKSGRTLERLERLLELPVSIQKMISAGQLNKSQGEKILRLPEDDRISLYAKLEAENDLKSALNEFGIVKLKVKTSRADLAGDLLQFLKRHTEDFCDHLEDLDCVQVRGAKATDVMKDAIEFLIEWCDRREKRFDESVAVMRNLINEGLSEAR